MIDNMEYKHTMYIITTRTYSGADPGFQVKGAQLKKIAPSGGRR
jgi:hypothetical protein